MNIKIYPQHQKRIYRHFQERPIAYNAGLAKYLGSVKAAVLLAQILFWQGKGRDLIWIYKTIEELTEETGLSRKEQDAAIRICKQKAFLHTKVAGLPPKRHFYIDIEKLELKLSERAKSDVLKSDTRKGRISQKLYQRERERLPQRVPRTGERILETSGFQSEEGKRIKQDIKNLSASMDMKNH